VPRVALGRRLYRACPQGRAQTCRYCVARFTARNEGFVLVGAVVGHQRSRAAAAIGLCQKSVLLASQLPRYRAALSRFHIVVLETGLAGWGSAIRTCASRFETWSHT
jgi:hypothetical protein